MANICSFDMIIAMADSTSAEKIYTELSRLSDEASSRHEGMMAGSERYLFDTAFTLVDKDVHAVGWVKWGFSDEEVVTLIKFLHNITPLKFVQVSYEECSNLLFGEYIFDGQMLFASYLPYESFPDDDNCADFLTKVESAYKAHKEVRLITEMML